MTYLILLILILNIVFNIDIPYFGIVSSKIYDKRYDLNFEIINFLFFDGDVPCSPSYIFLSLFTLQECFLMVMTSTTKTF